MIAETNSAYDYHVGGSLPLDAPTYVRRKADDDLYLGVLAGQFCYVLNSRQMGKSSLRVQTMHRLQAEGVACAAIDLTAIGSQDITPNQWYAGVTYTLANSCNLLDKVDVGAWWCDREFLSPVQRLSEFIREVLLKEIPQNLVIFVDEIDSALSLTFQVDDFFALIRSCYNNRADQPEYNRLTWALLGVATPSDLICSTNYGTPFNIGLPIKLTSFQLHEVQPLAQGLVGKVSNPQAVLREVLAWTGGQPFLTQKLCKLVLQESGVSRDVPAERLYESGEFLENPKSKIQNPKLSISAGSEAEWIENLVRSRLIENWEATDEPQHLRTIRDRLLKSGQRTVRLLALYQQILQYGEVIANDHPEQLELRLSGLVVKQDGKLKVYSRIYQSVFNLGWVEEMLANLTAETDEATWIEGTENGADAYLSKPFHDRELLAQVRNLLALKANEQRVVALNTYLTESVLKRFLPPATVQKAVRGELELDLSPEPRLITILSSDIVGFHQLANRLRSRRVAQLLNEYLEAMIQAVFDNGGTVDKFMEYAILAFFGAPEELTPNEQAQRALAAARQMLRSLKELKQRWQEQGLVEENSLRPVQFHCGIHQGTAVVGMFGSKDRADYTAIGSSVKVASRLQEAAEPNSILVSAAVADYLDDNVLTKGRPLQCRGVDETVSSFPVKPQWLDRS